MIITDEMVEKAWKAYEKAVGYDLVYESDGPGMAAALEVVVPMLIAQGMREAAMELHRRCLFDAAHVIDDMRHAILARAQELEQK